MLDNGSIVDGRYQIIENIGKGSQGSIYKVTDLTNSEIRALKVVDIDSDNFEKVINDLKSEFQLLITLNHPNIIKVYGLNYDAKTSLTYILMEYLEGKNLLESLKIDEEDTFIEYAYQILCGLHYLHENHIIHFDIKPENIIISNNNGKPCLKILDFGMSELKLCKSKKNRIKGTMNYIAPEFFIDSNNLTDKADIYSLGITLIHAFYKKMFISSLSGSISSEKIVENVYSSHDENIKLLEDLSNVKINNFIISLIERNPQLRISSAKDAILLLNRIFKRNLVLPENSLNFSLSLNNKFLLYHKKVDRIIKNINNTKTNKFIICGESGNGKSSIAKQLFYELNLNLQKSFVFDSDSVHGNFEFSIADDIIKKLSKHQKGKLFTDLPIWIELEKWRETNQNSNTIFINLFQFISDSEDFRKLFLFFDHIDSFDETSKKFIYYLLENKFKDKINLFFILKYQSIDDNMYHRIKFYKNNYDIDIIEINKLTIDDIQNVVKELCGSIIGCPNNFIKILLKYSNGNFKKVLEILDSLYENDIISNVNGLVTFKNSKKFTEILNLGAEDKTIRFLKKTSKIEEEILQFLVVNFDALSLENIDKLTSNNIFKTKLILKNLITEGLVSIIESKGIKYYVCDYQIVIGYILTNTTKKRLKNVYNELGNYKRQNIIKIGKGFSELSNLLIEKKFSEKSSKFKKDFVKKIIKNDNGFLLEKFIYLIKKLDFDYQETVLLYIQYLSCIVERQRSSTIKKIKKLEISLKRKSHITDKIALAFYLLKIEVYDLVHYRYRLVNLVNSKIDFFHNNLTVEEFYFKMIDICYTYLYANKAKELKIFVNQIGIILKNDIKNNLESKNIYFEYEAVFDVFTNYFIKKNTNENYFNELEKYLDFFIMNKISNDNYYTLLDLYYSFAFKKRFEYNVSQRLLEGVNIAYENKDIENIFFMISKLAAYYYEIGNYVKSLYFNNKIVNISNQFLIQPYISVFGNLMTSEFMLYYPMSEIISLIKEAKKQTLQQENMQLYLSTLLNEMIVTYRAGFFNNATNAFLEWFDMVKLYSEEAIIENFKRISVYFPELISYTEIVELLGISLREKKISKTIHNQIIEISKERYVEKICFRWSKNELDKVLDGSLKSETPSAIIRYIQKNRKLPETDLIFKNVNKRYYNKDLTGDYLILLITNFFITNNQKQLPEIFSYSQKLFSNGYIINSLYNLMALMKFFLIIKINDPIVGKFIRLYREIIEFVELNLSKKQQQFAYNLFIFEKGSKLVSKLEKLNKKK